MPAVTRGLLSLVLALTLSNCSSSPLDTSDEAAAPSTPTKPEVPASVELVPLYDAPTPWTATALAFDPLRSGELWVTLRRVPSNKPCLETARAGCAALEGQVALVRGAISDSPTMTLEKDGNAWHFMRRPTSIAFGENGNLATCGEARTDNYEDEAIDYSGPVLWSSDPAIFGVTPKAGQNGTHIDMLHESPFCMGIAFERDNVYWVFNGKLGALDRYDFHAPHVIGGEDHSDGELTRYVEGQLVRVPEVPSHLALDHGNGNLYVADTAGGRILRLALASGVPGADVPTLDPIAVHRQMDGASLVEVVAPGLLSAPSGIALSADRIIVTDNATSRIWWFKLDGAPIGSVDSGLPVGSLSGITLGPDGKLYLSDLSTGVAYRVEQP
jgi:sugar lactone lactonase YvrE